MTLTLTRNDFIPDGIFGTLEDDKGKLFLATLEHSFDNKPKIPAGNYLCVRGVHRLHNLIPFETFELRAVPEHTNILIHQGNYNNDSDGCILVGIDRDGTMIRHSMIAFSKFMGLLEKQDSFTLVVKD